MKKIEIKNVVKSVIVKFVDVVKVIKDDKIDLLSIGDKGIEWIFVVVGVIVIFVVVLLFRKCKK